MVLVDLLIMVLFFGLVFLFGWYQAKDKPIIEDLIEDTVEAKEESKTNNVEVKTHKKKKYHKKKKSS